MDTYTSTQIHADLAQNKKKKYRLRHRRMRAGRCAAAVHGVTAAKFYLTGQVPSVAAAALSCGSCTAYVRAALVLLKSENTAMLERVLCGQMPLLVAAAQVKQIAKLVNAYRAASPDDRIAFARAVGPSVLFDSTLVPAL